MKTSCWQRWRRRRQAAARRLGEAVRRLARGFGLWEGALYEIGGKSRSLTPTSPLWSLSLETQGGHHPACHCPLGPRQPTPPNLTNNHRPPHRTASLLPEPN